MILAYYRVGAFEDARRAMQKILSFAEQFRTDNPLVDFGNAVYQPKQPINCVYDTWGAPAAMVRGLFEYLYRADTLTLIPHIPTGITRIEQRFPIRFGDKRLHLSAVGQGKITAVTVNGMPWTQFDEKTVTLPFASVPGEARICIALGEAVPGAQPQPANLPPMSFDIGVACASLAKFTEKVGTKPIEADFPRMARFCDEMRQAGLDKHYVAAHSRLVLDYLKAIHERAGKLESGALAPLAQPESQKAADASYVEALQRLVQGLNKVLVDYEKSSDPAQQQIAALWKKSLNS